MSVISVMAHSLYHRLRLCCSEYVPLFHSLSDEVPGEERTVYRGGKADIYALKFSLSLAQSNRLSRTHLRGNFIKVPPPPSVLPWRWLYPSAARRTIPNIQMIPYKTVYLNSRERGSNADAGSLRAYKKRRAIQRQRCITGDPKRLHNTALYLHRACKV